MMGMVCVLCQFIALGAGRGAHCCAKGGKRSGNVFSLTQHCSTDRSVYVCVAGEPICAAVWNG